MQETCAASPQIFVLHVASGYENRGRHVESMMSRLGLDFEYMLRGDIPQITPEVLNKYFAAAVPDGFGSKADAFTSCTYKHLLVYDEIVKRRLCGALVLEDDAVLFKKFPAVFAKSIDELSTLPDMPTIVSFEDTRLRFVPRSRRIKGRLLYPGHCDRLAGCYYVNAAAASMMLDYAREKGIDRPIDNFHTLLLHEGLLRYLWVHPAVATQGSFTGLFPSSLSKRYARLLTPIVWRLKLLYRKLLYEFR